MASLSHQKNPPGLLIAQAIGITASGYLLGACASPDYRGALYGVLRVRLRD